MVALEGRRRRRPVGEDALRGGRKGATRERPLVRDGREGERTKYVKINKFRVFFANIHHRGATWHATSASDAHVARLGLL